MVNVGKYTIYGSYGFGEIFPQKCAKMMRHDMYLPWELKTFIFRGYNPYIGGLKPSFFMVLGSKGTYIYLLVI